ncbi:hypothetical protein RESH_04614 [Rhodopirellula europaea SH398]|uniref:Uncharacterized protein n=1 Tax=Rhodopirellula europaea SH398 TaxID=1263868 RepID=M5SAQ3_9BACT|nr:hypothetical protein RESH_04614 [Rhodopirellula europaea SH398]
MRTTLVLDSEFSANPATSERRLSRHNPPCQQGSDQKFFTS